MQQIAPIVQYTGPELDLYGNFAKGQEQGILRQENTRRQQEYDQGVKDRETTRGILAGIDPKNPNYESLALQLLGTDPAAANQMMQMESNKISRKATEQQMALASRAAARDEQEYQYKQKYRQVAYETGLADTALKNLDGVADPEQQKQVLDSFFQSIEQQNEELAKQGMKPVQIPAEAKAGDIADRIAALQGVSQLGNRWLDQRKRAEQLINGESPTPQTDLGKATTDYKNGLITAKQYEDLTKTLGNGDPKEGFKNANDLRDEYNMLSKDYFDIEKKYETIKASAKEPSAVGDMSMTFAYMKLLDPSSTVNRGEQASAENVGSIPENVWGAYNKALKGEKFADSVREDFVDRADKIYLAARKSQEPVKKRYDEMADRYGLDPENVTGGTMGQLEVEDASADAPAKPTTDEEYNDLPKGARFIDPDDGKEYVK